jgi:hypothetical protein
VTIELESIGVVKHCIGIAIVLEFSVCVTIEMHPIFPLHKGVLLALN